jgi:hypothetical protein
MARGSARRPKAGVFAQRDQALAGRLYSTLLRRERASSSAHACRTLQRSVLADRFPRAATGVRPRMQKPTYGSASYTNTCPTHDRIGDDASSTLTPLVLIAQPSAVWDCAGRRLAAPLLRRRLPGSVPRDPAEPEERQNACRASAARPGISTDACLVQSAAGSYDCDLDSPY